MQQPVAFIYLPVFVETRSSNVVVHHQQHPPQSHVQPAAAPSPVMIQRAHLPAVDKTATEVGSALAADVRSALVSFLINDYPSPEVLTKVLLFLDSLPLSGTSASQASQLQVSAPAVDTALSPERNPRSDFGPIGPTPTTSMTIMPPTPSWPPVSAPYFLEDRRASCEISEITSSSSASSLGAFGTASTSLTTTPKAAASLLSTAASTAHLAAPSAASPVPQSQSRDDASSNSDITSILIPREKLEKHQRRQQRIAALAPCTHLPFWKQLRTKKGIDHFICKSCGSKWRVPREIALKNMAAAQGEAGQQQPEEQEQQSQEHEDSC